MYYWLEREGNKFSQLDTKFHFCEIEFLFRRILKNLTNLEFFVFVL